MTPPETQAASAPKRTTAETLGASVLARNAAALFAIQGVTYLTPFVILPHLFRALGAEAMGRVLVMLALTQQLQLVVDYGFNLTASQRVARSQGDRHGIATLLSSVLAVRVGLCAVALVLGLGAVWLLPFLHRDMGLFLACFAQVLGQALSPQWLYQGLERLPAFSAYSAAARLACLGAALLVVRGPGDERLAALCLSLVFGLAALPALAHAWWRGGLGLPFARPSWAAARQELRDGWMVFRSTVAITLYTSANPLIAAAFASGPAVGYFTTLERLVRAVQNLVGPVGQALYPRVNALLTSNRPAAVALLRRAFVVMGLAGAAASAGLLVMAPMAVRLATGSPEPYAAAMLRILAAIPWLVALSNLFGIQTLLSFGRQEYFSRVLTITGVGGVALSMAACWALARTVGPHGVVLGAALTSTMAEAAVTWAFWRASGRLVGGWLCAQGDETA